MLFKRFIPALLLLTASTAMADVYQWQWVDPADHSLGKTQSNILCPDGAGIVAGPNSLWSGRDLSQAYLYQTDLSHGFILNCNFGNGYLAGATLFSADLLGCNFINADLTQVNAAKALFDQGRFQGADFSAATLSNCQFNQIWLDNTNFSNADLSSSSIQFSRLYGANFAGATINDLLLEHATDYGLTAGQIYSTRSYKNHDLRGLGLHSDNLSGWDFSGQDLTYASFEYSNLSSARFTNATFAGSLIGTNLDDADFNGADLRQSNLEYSRLHDADLTGANLDGTDLFAADLRGARNADLSAARITLSTIRPDGTVLGTANAYLELFVHDYRGEKPIPVHILGEVNRGLFALYLGADPWESTISFAPGIPVYIEGAGLDLDFDEGVDAASLIGRTWRIFDWTGVSPIGEFGFDNLRGYEWDTSRLYTDGAVTLIGIPEPSRVSTIAMFAALVFFGWRSRTRWNMPKSSYR